MINSIIQSENSIFGTSDKLKRRFSRSLMIVCILVLIIGSSMFIQNGRGTEKLTNEIKNDTVLFPEASQTETTKMVEWNFSQPMRFRYDGNLVNFSDNELKLSFGVDGKYHPAFVYMNFPVRDLYIEHWKNVSVEVVENGQSVGYLASPDDVFYYRSQFSGSNRFFASEDSFTTASITELNQFLPLSDWSQLYIVVKLNTDGVSTPIINGLKIFYNVTDTIKSKTCNAMGKADIENRYELDMDQEYIGKKNEYNPWGTPYGHFMCYFNFSTNLTMYYFASNNSMSQFMMVFSNQSGHMTLYTLNFLSFGLYVDQNANKEFDANETFYQLRPMDWSQVDSIEMIPLEKTHVNENISTFKWGIRYNNIKSLVSWENSTLTPGSDFLNITQVTLNYTVSYNNKTGESVISKTNEIGTIGTAPHIHLESGNYGAYIRYAMNYVDLEAEEFNLQDDEAKEVGYESYNALTAESLAMCMDGRVGAEILLGQKDTYDLYDEDAQTYTQQGLQSKTYMLSYRYGFDQDINFSVCQSPLYNEGVNITSLIAFYLPDMEYYLNPNSYHLTIMAGSAMNLLSVFPEYDGNKIINDPIFSISGFLARTNTGDDDDDEEDEEPGGDVPGYEIGFILLSIAAWVVISMRKRNQFKQIKN